MQVTTSLHSPHTHAHTHQDKTNYHAAAIMLDTLLQFHPLILKLYDAALYNHMSSHDCIISAMTRQQKNKRQWTNISSSEKRDTNSITRQQRNKRRGTSIGSSENIETHTQ